jgi:hypothetical protein
MGSLQSEIQKTLNSWEAPKTTIGTGSIASKVFNFIKDHPTATSDDVALAVGIDTGRSSATLLSLYQKGKLERKAYPNPNPDGKRHHVYTYWTAVDSFTDRGVDRKPKKAKKTKIDRPVLVENVLPGTTQSSRPGRKSLEELFVEAKDELDKETHAKKIESFVHNLNVHDAKKIYGLLKRIFE